MSIRDIEAAIAEFPDREVAELMARLAERHARLWDAQIADDLEAGRLGTLLAEVDQGYRAGLAKPLWLSDGSQARGRAAETTC